MRHFLLIMWIPFLVSGCQQMRQTFGLERNSPDEYETLDLPPLTLPPDYQYLPQPVAEEKSLARERARAILMKKQKNKKTTKTAGEAHLLKQAGADSHDPQVREKLREENEKFMKENSSLLSNYIPYQRNVDVLDPEAEKRRLDLEKKKLDASKSAEKTRNECDK